MRLIFQQEKLDDFRNRETSKVASSFDLNPLINHKELEKNTKPSTQIVNITNSGLAT